MQKEEREELNQFKPKSRDAAFSVMVEGWLKCRRSSPCLKAQALTAPAVSQAGAAMLVQARMRPVLQGRVGAQQQWSGQQFLA